MSDFNTDSSNLMESYKFINDIDMNIALIIYEMSRFNKNKLYISGHSSYSHLMHACLVVLDIKFNVSSYVTNNCMVDDGPDGLMEASGYYVENLFKIYIGESGNYSDKDIKHSLKVIESFGLLKTNIKQCVEANLKRYSTTFNDSLNSFDSFDTDSIFINLYAPNTPPSREILHVRQIDSNILLAKEKKKNVKTLSYGKTLTVEVPTYIEKPKVKPESEETFWYTVSKIALVIGIIFIAFTLALNEGTP